MHNFDSLQNLLTDLNHKFDIVAVSETWNSKQKESNFRLKQIKLKLLLSP